MRNWFAQRVRSISPQFGYKLFRSACLSTSGRGLGRNMLYRRPAYKNRPLSDKVWCRSVYSFETSPLKHSLALFLRFFYPFTLAIRTGTVDDNRNVPPTLWQLLEHVPQAYMWATSHEWTLLTHMCFRTLLGGSSIIIAIANIMIMIITFTIAVYTTYYIIPVYAT